MLLKLSCNESLSNFAFEFNLHHYNKDDRTRLYESMYQLEYSPGEDIIKQAGAYTRPLFSST